MSSGAFPKTKLSKTSLSREQRDGARVQASSSEFSFDLQPKPKLTCIPENCSKFFKDLRKTQSLNVAKDSDVPEKSWSVLFIGSKNKSSLIM